MSDFKHLDVRLQFVLLVRGVETIQLHHGAVTHPHALVLAREWVRNPVTASLEVQNIALRSHNNPVWYPGLLSVLPQSAHLNLALDSVFVQDIRGDRRDEVTPE